MPQHLVRAFDVAEKLNYSLETVRKKAKQGELPGAVFIGRRILFDAEKFNEFINDGGSRLATQPVKSAKKQAKASKREPVLVPRLSIESTTHKQGNEYSHRHMNGRNVSEAHPWGCPTIH